jgi:hypothetical protein
MTELQRQSMSIIRNREPSIRRRSQLDASYLCGMVDLKGGLAFCIEVAVALNLVKFADNNLPGERQYTNTTGECS